MNTPTRARAVPLDGTSLTIIGVADIAHRSADVSVPEKAMSALDGGRGRLVTARETGAVYGANTGVGANRGITVGGDPEPGSVAHALRLLRSHCAGVGPVEDDFTARAAMVIRLNQLLAGGSGVSAAVGRGLLDALHTGSVPRLHRLGAIGTADLSTLAELALTLAGELPWLRGGIAPVSLADSDALPFMSSSALTLATAALATQDLKALLKSSIVVAALSFLALDGSAEAYDEAVHRARPHPYQAAIARELRELTGSPIVPSARLQDPFGLRVVPQVHAPAVAALHRLIEVLETEVNAATENPLVTTTGVRHHGQFHLATLASALDHTRTSVYPVLTLSAARLGLLLRPDMSQLAPFLAATVPGSSGLMITEYVVQDALAGLRVAVAPVSGSSVNISLGMEEHASFATQGARLLREVATLAPTIIAIEAVAAVRALRLAPHRIRSASAREAFEFLAGALEADIDDRSLGADIETATRLLPGLARFVGDGL